MPGVGWQRENRIKPNTNRDSKSREVKPNPIHSHRVDEDEEQKRMYVKIQVNSKMPFYVCKCKFDTSHMYVLPRGKRTNGGREGREGRGR